jgi:hypothetical protein
MPDLCSRWVLLLVLVLVCGPSLLATSHLMVFSREPTIRKIRLASRFLVGLDAMGEAWRYLVRGGKFD